MVPIFHKMTLTQVFQVHHGSKTNLVLHIGIMAVSVEHNSHIHNRKNKAIVRSQMLEAIVIRTNK